MITADLWEQGGDFNYPIVNKTAEIADYLNSIGIDHSKINTIHTPFIGAQEYTKLQVLLASPNITQVDLPDQQANVRKFFNFRIYEEGGGGYGGGGRGDGSTGTSGGVITQDGSVFEQGRGAGSTGGGEGGDPKPMLTAPTSKLEIITNLGRTMAWTSLSCISRYELLMGAASPLQGIATQLPQLGSNRQSIWLYTFVDQRYFLKDLLPLPITGVSQTKSVYFHSKINVVSDNPLHLIPDTCKSSKAVEGLKTLPDPSPSKITGSEGIPYRNYWYEQTSFTGLDIFNNLVGILNAAQHSTFGVENISFRYKDVVNTVLQNKYDFVDLDLSGLTIGQAMDLIASRIGCVWSWDRSLSQMVLRSTNSLYDKNDANVAYWNIYNSPYRSSGGLSSVTQESPSAVYTIHKIKEVNLYGTAPENTCQSYKNSEYVNGVEYDSLGSYYVAAFVRTGLTERRIVCINDHQAAFLGNCKFDINGFVNATVMQDRKTTDPWNFNVSTLGLYSTKDYATSLKERNVVLYARYFGSLNNWGGDISLARLPVGSNGSNMNVTPSVNLSCDFVDFNNSQNRMVFYRLYGGYEKDLIYPYLKNTSPLILRGIAQSSNQNGIIGIDVPKPSNSIVRSFPCRILSADVISTDPKGVAIAWKYRFEEVCLTDIGQPDWQQGIYESKNDRYPESYCFNLAEAQFIKQSANTPSHNSDGTQLNYKTDSFPNVQVVPLLPNTYHICYEIVGRKGLTTFHINKTNGLSVRCPVKVPFVPPNPTWNRENISGVGFSDSTNLANQVIL